MLPTSWMWRITFVIAVVKDTHLSSLLAYIELVMQKNNENLYS